MFFSFIKDNFHDFKSLKMMKMGKSGVIFTILKTERVFAHKKAKDMFKLEKLVMIRRRRSRQILSFTKGEFILKS